MPTKNVELKPDSKEHQFVRRQIMDRARFSEKEMLNRQTSYKEQEDQFLAYIHERDIDRKTKSMFKDGEPQYTTLRIPYTYGEIMTMHTFFTTVMLGRQPVLQYNGRHGESQQHKLAVEAIMNYQMQSGRNIVPLHIWILDALKYGRGVVWADWEERYSYFQETRTVERPIYEGGVRVSTETEEVEEPMRILQYMGNKFFTTKPQNFRPDPRVPIAYLQEGEFVGREYDLTMNDLIKGGREGIYFNVDAARREFKASSADKSLGEQSTLVDDVVNENPALAGKPTGKVKALEMYVELVPDDWGLKDFKMPQKWVFTVVNEKVIIEARPLGFYHDQFPCFALEPEFDGYSLHSRSPQEIIKPLEDTLTWLFNSHFYNTRRALNDQVVFDPTMIEAEDVLSPLPGGGIRAKPAAYGQDLRRSVFQVPVADVTRQNIGDSAYVMNILQRVDGVNDSLLGVSRQQGGRQTATQVRQDNQFAVNRLKSKAEFLSAQGLAPLAEVALQQTQQYYDQEMKFRIAGNLVNPNEDPFVDVTPNAIAGFYDFVPVDGSIPLDRFALANLWRQIFADAARIPGMGQQLDFMSIFSHFAKLSGATDIDQFRVKTQLQDPEELDRARDRGDVVPIGEPPKGPSPEGDERAAGRAPTAPQISGMGGG